MDRTSIIGCVGWRAETEGRDGGQQGVVGRGCRIQTAQVSVESVTIKFWVISQGCSNALESVQLKDGPVYFRINVYESSTLEGVVVGDDFVSIGPNKSPRGVKEGQHYRDKEREHRRKEKPCSVRKGPQPEVETGSRGKTGANICMYFVAPSTHREDTDYIQESVQERERERQVLGFVQTGSRGGLEVSPGTDV
ncbi:hypothetical protein OJ252_2640 [Cryptosporidium canis]|uniref:Uncharacterized protein n=1 Tax=Cryptosporidium canis TaxID=195482 RepID=A0ABQ8P4Z3_9CRYT|nr:hypothetical protein OJ252_2640 [Cryptosporidium canis]